MTYDEAESKLNGSNAYKHVIKINNYFQHDDIEGCIKYLMEQTGCDEIIAKQIYEKFTKNSKKVPRYTSDSEPSKPKCPTCGSTDIKKISTISKVGSVAFWGIFSQKHKKQFKCQNPYCGYEW